MAIPAPAARAPVAGPDHRFHRLRVREVTAETADAVSIVLDTPAELRETFSYAAGQFCTFRVTVDGARLERCYSMSSSPAVDPDLKVTVKRVPGGPVSNWLNEAIAAGDVLEVSPPSGLFHLGDSDRDIVAFGGGSGITPIISIVKTALATTPRRVRLLYANRDREAVIFAAELDALVAQHPDRLDVIHHLDVKHGFVDPEVVRTQLGDIEENEYYVCGPGPFMDVVEQTLLGEQVDAARIHIERFTTADLPAMPEPADPGSSQIEVTIELDGKVGTTEHHPGTTILQTARQLGMTAPSSCESGNCATCMAKLVVGDATMRSNNALTPDEVDDGWILTCQAVPTTSTVRVIYE